MVFICGIWERMGKIIGLVREIIWFLLCKLAHNQDRGFKQADLEPSKIIIGVIIGVL